jgi:hypothetical protein
MNIIWENKGIVLGIISYLVENHVLLKNNVIVIQNTKFKTVISNLFPDFKIVDNGPGFKINIKNQKNSGLVINNLQNLSTINAKKVKVLPWFDIDNPIVMYLHTKKKVYDKDFFEKDLHNFNKNTRYQAIQSMDPQYVEFVAQHCGLNIWDTQTEYNILLSYVKRYPSNLLDVNQYIDNELGGLRCEKPVIIPVPVKVPGNTPMIIQPTNLQTQAFQQQTQALQQQNNLQAQAQAITDLTNKIQPKTIVKREYVQVPPKVIVQQEPCPHRNIDASIDMITEIIRRLNQILEARLLGS